MYSIYRNFFIFLLLILSASGCRKENDSPPIQPTEEKPVGNLQVFPRDNPWNTDISNEDTDPNSDNLIASIGNDIHLHPDFGTVWENAPIGIPFNVVGSNQPLFPVTFQYHSESDAGPYPIPIRMHLLKADLTGISLSLIPLAYSV